MFVTPRTAGLPPELAAAARAIASRLREHGHRAWIVGGAVRDLALGRHIHDVDLVSAARPEEVQRLFPRTVAVGAAFGIVVVVLDGLEVEVATFREERGYSDARRPDEVRYALEPADDAARRDFTCNALYLDPLDDTLFDPTGGLADLAARRLVTVGDAATRFHEDGLRLLRMARFEASLDLAPAAGLHAAASGALDALGGVSPERVLDELSKVLRGPRAGRTFRVLEECGVSAVVVPGHAALAPEVRRERLALLDGHGAVRGPDDGVVVGLVALLAPPRAVPDAGPAAAEGTTAADGRLDPSGSRGPSDALGREVEADPERRLREHLERLRASRATQSGAAETLRLASQVPALARDSARPSARLRALRSPWFPAAHDLARRVAEVRGEPLDPLDRLARWCGAAGDPAPRPWIVAGDLAALGVQPGPRFGALLAEAEDQQLDGLVHDRAAALAWLAARVAPGG